MGRGGEWKTQAGQKDRERGPEGWEAQGRFQDLESLQPSPVAP